MDPATLGLAVNHLNADRAALADSEGAVSPKGPSMKVSWFHLPARSSAGRHRRAAVAAAAFVVLAGVLGPISPALAASQAISSAGPLTRIEISTDLNCAVDHVGDVAPEFFGDTACGTLIATGGTLYGPADIPAGSSASPRTAFTPISQSGVTGSGTAADPYRIVTVVALGSTGLQVTETDSYVVGLETYRTDVAIA